MTKEHIIFEQKKKTTNHKTPQNKQSKGSKIGANKQDHQTMLAKLGKIGEEEYDKSSDKQEGKKQNRKPRIKKAEESSGKDVEEMFDQPGKILMTMSTVFPFDFFPDHIRIDSLKVIINKSIFFFSGSIKSILIKDIADAYVEEGPLFATLKIVTKKEPSKPIAIAPLSRKNAEKAMRILDGLIMKREKLSE